MSALNFLNVIDSDDIQILSIERPTDELSIEKDESNNTSTVRMLLRVNIEEEPKNVELMFHMTEELLPMSFSSSDLNLMKRKVNPFQIKLFLESLFYCLSNTTENELTKLASEDVNVESFLLYIQRYKKLISFYHDTLSTQSK
jgi:hypothetical protein